MSETCMHSCPPNDKASCRSPRQQCLQMRQDRPLMISMTFKTCKCSAGRMITQNVISQEMFGAHSTVYLVGNMKSTSKMYAASSDF